MVALVYLVTTIAKLVDSSIVRVEEVVKATKPEALAVDVVERVEATVEANSVVSI